jgi:hypothetical protein
MKQKWLFSEIIRKNYLMILFDSTDKLSISKCSGGVRMLDMAAGLKQSLQQLREEWQQDLAQGLSHAKLRELIVERRIGTFLPLEKWDTHELSAYLSGKTVAGVDGSTVTFGGGYPGTITLLQAGAMTMTRKKYLLGDSVSPLSKKDQTQMRKYKERFGLSVEEAYTRYRDERLAVLEIMSAVELLQQEEPKLVMFDGGFVRYESKAGPWWEEYQSFSKDKKVLSVGIIEEVGTNFIAQALKETISPLPYDRQLLFGVLNKGEALLVNPALRQKGFSGRYYTCFARLSAHPSIIGCDLFAQDRDQLIPLLRYLYTNTLETSRGVPFWIDRVDHEIKLSYGETEALVRQAFPPGWVEKYLVSQRSRRNI